MNSTNHFLATVLAAFLVLGPQQFAKPATADAGSPQISIEHKYLHLLRWQNHLDKVAAAHEKQGRDGASLRAALQKQLHFTDQQFAPIRESARRLAASLDAVNAKAKPIVANYRARRANGTLSAQDRAAAHAQLRPLMAERANLITTEIANLNSILGPTLAATLRQFVETKIAQTGNSLAPRLNP